MTTYLSFVLIHAAVSLRSQITSHTYPCTQCTDHVYAEYLCRLIKSPAIYLEFPEYIPTMRECKPMILRYNMRGQRKTAIVL